MKFGRFAVLSCVVVGSSFASGQENTLTEKERIIQSLCQVIELHIEERKQTMEDFRQILTDAIEKQNSLSKELLSLERQRHEELKTLSEQGAQN